MFFAFVMKPFFRSVFFFLAYIPNCMTQAPLLFRVIDPNPANYLQSDKGTNVFMLDSFYYIVDGFINATGNGSQEILKTDRWGNVVARTTLEGPTADIAIAEGGGY